VSDTTANLIHALVERGAPDEARSLADQSLRGAAGAERAELLLALAFVHTHRGEQLAALAAAVEAGELFQAAGSPQRTCDALVHTASTLRAAGDHETALSTLEHAESLARGAGDELRRARALRQIGIVSSVLGRHQHALSCLEEACRLLARLAPADEQRAARLSYLNVISRRLDGAPDDGQPRPEVEAHLRDWLDLAEQCSAAGQLRLALMAWGNHAIVLQAAGRHREAAQALRALVPRYREFSMRPNEGLAFAEMGRCHESLGEPEQARQHYRDALALLREGGVQQDLQQALEGLARCEEALGDVAAALAALKELRAFEKQRRDEAARQVLVQRELRVELARLTHQWARQAAQDPLTGLANRRALERWLAEHWPRVERGQPLALVLLDLDHFKRINDTLGHDTGDRVLQAVAELLRSQCRAADLAVRYGGEEFLLAMADSDRDAASPLAERLRELISSQPWSRLAPGLGVSSSFGVADATEALDAQALLTLADRRLYAAKFGGRNRVVAHG
jgi:diguanylate cyclase